MDGMPAVFPNHAALRLSLCARVDPQSWAARTGLAPHRPSRGQLADLAHPAEGILEAACAPAPRAASPVRVGAHCRTAFLSSVVNDSALASVVRKSRQGGESLPLLRAFQCRLPRGPAKLSYPIVFEPKLSTLGQAWIWSLAYGGAAAVCGAIALLRRDDTSQERDRRDVSRPGWKTKAIWIALSACSSALLLAITNHVSQNIAAVPLLWVIPLSLYLLSFNLCFAGERWYQRTFLLRFLGVAIGGMTYALSPSLAVLPLWLSIPLFYAGLFLCCMFCHGELALCKPAHRS